MSLNTEPAWYQKWLKGNNEPPKPILSTNPQQNSITFHCGEGNEMLKVAEDGFYVRGVKLKQDDKEAQAVYNAFSEWMNWQILNRN